MKHALPEPEQLNSLVQQLLNSGSAFSLPEHGTSHMASLHALCEPLLQEAALHQQPEWAAHMTPTLAPYSLLGQQIAALHSGNLLSAELYPALKQAEQSLLQWLCQHFGQSHAHFTHGGSYANLEALWRARDLSAHSNNLVYGSRATHYSVLKACQLLGLTFKPIDTDEQDRLLPEALQHACLDRPPVAIVLNAGTSAAGVIDPLEPCMTIGQTYQSWIHIDAAWGGATMMLPENRQRYQLLQSADSISFDPHKALSQPKPSSVLLSRHGGQSLSAQVDYLSSSPDNRLPGSYGGELFLPLWLNLQMLGEDWFYQQIRQRLAQSRQFGLHLAGLTDWPVSVSETGIVCFEPQQPDLLKTLPDQGIFSRASIHGRPVYRAVFASAHTQATSLIKVLHPYL